MNTRLIVVFVFLFISFCAGALIYPTGLTAQQGSFSSQSISVLATNELSGTTDNWNTYIEFYGKCHFILLINNLIIKLIYFSRFINSLPWSIYL